MIKETDGQRFILGVENIFKNWLAQSKELGEVMVEEIDPTGYTCFEAAGEKLYRIWLKIGTSKNQILTEERGLHYAR